MSNLPNPDQPEMEHDGGVVEDRRGGPRLLTARFGVILFILSMLFNSFVYWQVTQRIDQDELASISRQNDINNCERGNARSREINSRNHFHRTDADNLAMLSDALATTRKAEGDIFTSLAAESPDPNANEQVKPLVHIYRRAERIDRGIQKTQQSLKLRPLTIYDCEKEVESVDAG